MNEFHPYELIEASAGTGKTQALAERLIALQELEVNPSEIAALTFSRAAAGEIFERYVTMLAEKEGAADRLREVLRTQHLSLIGTLDSFLMRMVRVFPRELGLSGQLELMDDFRAKVEAGSLSFSILRRTDRASAEAFTEAFALAMNHEDVRSFASTYRKFVSNWHELVLAYPKAASWSFVPEGIDPDGEVPTLPEELKDLETAIRERRDFPETGVSAKLLKCENLFGEGFLEFSFRRKVYSYDTEKSAAIRKAIRIALARTLVKCSELARGVHTLISAFEREYDRTVRSRGRIVFSDIPRLLAKMNECDRLNLEFRMDARLRAWALDEFQDTSREQWKALSNLLDEAKQSDGEKSLFIVGDIKQAIYGWRNGDVGIFRREKESGFYFERTLNKSYRYGVAITEAVNRVFTEGRIPRDFPEFKAEKHETAKSEVIGFVHTIESPGGFQRDFVEPVFNALKAVDPIGRGLSAAVLVRGNTFGELLANELRLRGMEGVVWEGESAILDTPALNAFLDYVQLAEHPSDLMSYRHFTTTPLAKAMYPEGIPTAAEISCEASLSLTEKGLVRTFRVLRSFLPAAADEAWDEFTELRFTDMLRAAAEFELQMRPGSRLGDFVAFLESKKKRNVAEPGKIRIMTIHRSKGLGFDYVVLPLYEKNSIYGDGKDKVLMGDGWVLPDPGSHTNSAFPELKAAAEMRRVRKTEEELCNYYVAMTRAKKAMTIILHPQPKSASNAVRFSNLVREALPTEIGDREWYLKETAPEPAAKGCSTVPDATGFVRAPRRKLRRRLPSLVFGAGESAGDLFQRSARAEAMRRGTEIHEKLSKVEFDDDRLKKPDGFVGLWRERAFELLVDGEWISGRFDRVVFTEVDGVRRAEICDFKTNRNWKKLPLDEFEAELEERYAAQMSAYRLALSRLTSLPLSAITTRIIAV